MRSVFTVSASLAGALDLLALAGGVADQLLVLREEALRLGVGLSAELDLVADALLALLDHGQSSGFQRELAEHEGEDREQDQGARA